MLRLVGGTHFLVLRRSTDLAHHDVFSYARFNEALEDWKVGSRISPIFPIDAAPVPAFADGQRVWLLFFGPVYPGKVDLPSCSGIYLTHGLFNVLLYSTKADQAHRGRQFADSCGTPWEEWEVLGHRLVNTDFSPVSQCPAEIPKETPKPFESVAPDLLPTVREYLAQMANALGRASIFRPSVIPDLVRFDSGLRRTLDDPNMGSVRAQGQLIIANAALARHNAYTYAGTSPIVQTECSLWTHSLLGVGTASLALDRITRFLEGILGAARISDRLQHLKTIRAHSKPLLRLQSKDSFWEDKEHLFDHGEPANVAAARADDDLPLITYFSGSDGFRATLLSLSVPVEVLTGCNTASWTLQTLTHEAMHTIIEAVLGILLPNPDDKTDLAAVHSLLQAKEVPGNLYDQLRQFLAYGIWAMKGVIKQHFSAEELGDQIRQDWGEANEILTHVADFLYHYRREPSNYTRSLWASWAVIPNIAHRTSQYLVRSLCALYATNLTRTDGASVAVDLLVSCLKEIRDEFPHALYVSKGLELLQKDRDEYIKRLKDRAVLVKFVRYFIYAERIGRLLMSDPRATGGSKVYDLKPLEFTQERISNPLRFLEVYSTNTESHAQKALWMLQQLAFGESP